MPAIGWPMRQLPNSTRLSWSCSKTVRVASPPDVDHTTVMHADRKIRQLMSERRAIYNQVTELTNRIKQQSR